MSDNRFISDDYPGLPSPKGETVKKKVQKDDVSFNKIDKDSSHIAGKNKKNSPNVLGMVVVWQENF